MTVEKTRIAVLVSGGGTNLQALLDAEARGELPSGNICLVVSNVKGACGGQAGFEAALQRELEARRIELIVLAGFLSILSGDFSARWDKRIINIHPSLIPSFCGKGYYGLKVHEEALKYGVKVTGATVHYVNEIPDGGQIILQKAVDILPEDTAETLQRRVMEQAEWILLPRAAELVSARIKQEKAGKQA